MDEILNSPFNKKVCPRCGEIQKHALRWCYLDGAEFIMMKPNWTLLDAIKFAHNRENTNIRLGGLRPDYVAAVYKRDIEPHGITEEEFTEYIKEKIKT
jgi:hypothetical protein